MSIYFELEDLPKRYQEQIKRQKRGKAAKVLEQLEPKQPKEAKYHNKKAEVDGIIFDSEKERGEWDDKSKVRFLRKLF